jgi:hypothetical protein
VIRLYRQALILVKRSPQKRKSTSFPAILRRSGQPDKAVFDPSQARRIL